MEIHEVPIHQIETQGQQVREIIEDDGIIELAESIAKRGLLQPIGVSRTAHGTYQLLWGRRRLAAHHRLEHETITAHVYALGEQPVRALALVENLQRAQMTLKEECDAVAFLHYEERQSPDQIGALLSKSRSWVLRRLALPTLPPELRGPVFDGRLAIGAAEYIARVQDEGSRRYVAGQALQCGWSYDDVKTAVDTYLATPSIEAAVQTGREAEPPDRASAPIQVACRYCGITREPVELVLIHVCREHLVPTPAALDGIRNDTQQETNHGP